MCVTCRRTTNGFTRCWQCNQHFTEFGAELADEVVPVSLAEKDKQLARVLSQYKNSKFAEVRRHLTNELAYVLATFLARHEDCLGEFDLVTVLPSSQGRKPPLTDVVGRRISLTSRRFAESLLTRCENDRKMRPACYEVTVDVRGRGVLLIDDTWTSGASLQSSAVAMKRAGAARVVGLVIGRHLDEPCVGEPFDWDECCLCGQV
ncbi:MAG: hypothetical protein QOF58_2398 [Pseudonocardiales bacterium]|nr:hypothetical protein [Pseudonocardiales bacterium]